MNVETYIREAEDRRQIRQLVDEYAYCADACEVNRQAALFTEDTRYTVDYLDNPEVRQEVRGRAALLPLFTELTRFHAKTHVNGQSTVLDLTETGALGVVYCLAHHITLDEGRQRCVVASIRYDDRYVKQDGRWLFAERHLSINWVERR